MSELVPAAPEPVSSTAGGVASVAFSDYTISSNSESVEQLKESDSADKERLTESARTLGKKGGAASAAKRAEASADPLPAEDPKPTDAAPASPEPKLGKPRDDPRARMLEATREAAELKRQLAERTAELEQVRQGKTAQPEARAEQLPDPNVPPKWEDYEGNWEDFTADMADWKANQVVQKVLGDRAAAAAAQGQQQAYYGRINAAAANVKAKIEEAFPTKEEFHKSVNSRLLEIEPSFALPQGVRPGPENAMIDEIYASDNPVPLLQYLSNHEDVMDKILESKTPREVARWMARIEDRVSDDRAPVKVAPKPEVSRAKPPARPITAGQSSASVDLLDPDLDYDSYRKLANAQDRAAGRR